MKKQISESEIAFVMSFSKSITRAGAISVIEQANKKAENERH